jgi:hypothetical protein
MNVEEIIAALDAEIQKLSSARAVLTLNGASAGLGVQKKKRGRKSGLSPEGRARIAAAAKKRWAAHKKATGK